MDQRITTPSTGKQDAWQGIDMQKILLALIMLLASCSEVAPPAKEPQEPPTPPAEVKLPEAGTLPGGGDGTPIGTVRISPSQTEVQMMQLINELRTQGSLNKTRIEPSCMSRQELLNLKLAPLKYDGAAAVAARNHASYGTVTGVLENAHAETPGTTGFTGETPAERVKDSAQMYQLSKALAVGEVAARSQEKKSPLWMVESWVKSPGHCKALLNQQITHQGAGGVERSGLIKPATEIQGEVWPNVYIVVLTIR